MLSSTANASFSEDDAGYLENVKHSNDMVFNFWDQFTDYDTDVYLPPEYFAGFELNSDGTLTIYVTDNSCDVLDDLCEVCGGSDFQIIIVQHSFNTLCGVKDAIIGSDDSILIDSIAYNLSENKVTVFASQENIRKLKLKPSSLIEIKERDTKEYAFNTDNSAYDNKEHLLASNSKQMNTTTFYPGIQTNFNNNNSFGTVGFCATDGLGRKLLITHSHGYGFSGPNNAKSVAVAGVTMSAYSLSYQTGNGQDQYYDAAYIVIPTNISTALSNKINNQGSVRLSYVAYDSQLSSYNGMAVNAYGCASGFMVGTSQNPITAILYQDTLTSLWSLSMSGCYPANGDSGGPIYLVGSNQNRLLGIIRTTYGDGILWKNIRDRYYSITGYTLTPYTANT
jgi:hypothetical protein